MWQDYKTIFITMAILASLVLAILFIPGPQWKCPHGAGLVDGMCVPGATAPARE
jgi:hypothetical protein